MPIKILMPALSPTMTEGNLARWLKKEGDAVEPGDVIAEIETDKATMEVEAADGGTLGRIVVPAGTQGVKVNAVIAMLLSEGEGPAALGATETAAPAAPPASPTRASGATKSNGDGAPAVAKSGTTTPPATPLARRIAAQSGIDLGAVPGTGAHGKITRGDVEGAITGTARVPATAAAPPSTANAPPAAPAAGERIAASPLAKRMAAQAGLDLAAIPGTGPAGRIVKTDIEAAIASGRVAPPRSAAPAGKTPAAKAPAPVARVPGERPAPTRETLSTMRKVIAERMSHAKASVPHFYMTVDCEIDELLRVRAELNKRNPDSKISVNDFVILASAHALREVPETNVSWDDGAMLRHHTVDISVAVAIEGGLITPIVFDADRKGLAQIAAEMKDLGTRARAMKLLPHEYQGGTFTISNLGMFGIKEFDAVINEPQACILAVGAGEQRPVVRDGKIEIATVMSLTLSVDHRVVDGATGAKLLTAIKRLIDYPPAMLL